MSTDELTARVAELEDALAITRNSREFNKREVEKLRAEIAAREQQWNKEAERHERDHAAANGVITDLRAELAAWQAAVGGLDDKDAREVYATVDAALGRKQGDWIASELRVALPKDVHR
jgi:chromosome segregation ATPase